MRKHVVWLSSLIISTIIATLLFLFFLIFPGAPEEKVPSYMMVVIPENTPESIVMYESFSYNARCETYRKIKNRRLKDFPFYVICKNKTPMLLTTTDASSYSFIYHYTFDSMRECRRSSSRYNKILSYTPIYTLCKEILNIESEPKGII